MTENKPIKFLIGLLTSLAITFVSILILAAVVHFLYPSELVVRIVNQVIKTVSIFFGAMIAIRKKGLLLGALFGFIYAAICFLGFGLALHNLCFDLGAVIDLVFGAIIGSICGIISTNLRR